MLILLPPSESKRGRSRGRPVDLTGLSFPSLSDTRLTVAGALAKVSAHPDWPAQLGVSPTLADEVARNLALDTAPALPASRVYSGVLYDALDYASLTATGRRRANRWLVVVSALYGAVRPTDHIAPYRLSMGVNLPGVGPLAAAWRPHLEEVLTQAAGRGLVVDCRSSTYAAAWTPRAPVTERWVQVRVPGATHQAKHTRGLVARALCEAGTEARSVQALTDVLGGSFDLALHEPQRPGRPWVLDATTPAPPS